MLAVAVMQESAINNAIGEAETISRRAQATADGLRMIAGAIESSSGSDAVSMTLAQQYVDAFGKIAQTGNTMIVPADAGNVASMIAQATSVFQRMHSQGGGAAGGGGERGQGNTTVQEHSPTQSRYTSSDGGDRQASAFTPRSDSETSSQYEHRKTSGAADSSNSHTSGAVGGLLSRDALGGRNDFLSQGLGSRGTRGASEPQAPVFTLQGS